MMTVFADDNENARLMMQKMMKRIDPAGLHYTTNNAEGAFGLIAEHKTDVLFLDIEMPGVSGIEAAHYVENNFPGTNVIFVTGHPEYALDALRAYCSGFIEKPFDENDIRDALKHLRYPIEHKNELVVRCSGSFAVFLNGEPLTFKRKLTMELFAYLVYKDGAMCNTGELLSILWEGDRDKANFLRSSSRICGIHWKNPG